MLSNLLRRKGGYMKYLMVILMLVILSGCVTDSYKTTTPTSNPMYDGYTGYKGGGYIPPWHRVKK